MSRTNKDRKVNHYPRSFAGDQLIKDWMEQRAYVEPYAELDLATEAMAQFEIPFGPKEQAIPVWLIQMAREAIDMEDAKIERSLAAAREQHKALRVAEDVLAEIIRDQ